MRSTSTHASFTLLIICILITLITLIGVSGCVDSRNDTTIETAGPDDTTAYPQAVNESTYIMTKDGVPLRYVIHDGGTRAATHGQEGPPIVFVPGYGMTLDEWPNLMISHLATSHTVILFNHRGVSGIKNPDVPFTIRQGAIDLHDVILQLAGENEECRAGIVDNCTGPLVDIVGYSMGGMIALEYGVMYPDTVNRLILLNTDCGGAERVPAEEWVMEWMSQTLKTPEENLERAGSVLLTESFRTTHPDPLTWFVDYGEVADPVAVQEQFKAFRLWEGVYEELPAIGSRTLLITGDQDIVIPPENAVKIADQIPDATLIIHKGQAHGMIFVEPIEIATIIEDFLG